jgi:hypothetical protein
MGAVGEFLATISLKLKADKLAGDFYNFCVGQPLQTSFSMAIDRVEFRVLPLFVPQMLLKSYFRLF